MERFRRGGKYAGSLGNALYTCGNGKCSEHASSHIVTTVCNMPIVSVDQGVPVTQELFCCLTPHKLQHWLFRHREAIRRHIRQNVVKLQRARLCVSIHINLWQHVKYRPTKNSWHQQATLIQTFLTKVLGLKHWEFFYFYMLLTCNIW